MEPFIALRPLFLELSCLPGIFFFLTWKLEGKKLRFLRVSAFRCFYWVYIGPWTTECYRFFQTKWEEKDHDLILNSKEYRSLFITSFLWSISFSNIGVYFYMGERVNSYFMSCLIFYLILNMFFLEICTYLFCATF